MRRTFLALVTAVVATVALVLPVSAQTPQTVTVNPSEGNQFQDYTFRGTGFKPGEQIDIAFADPTGTTFSLQMNGKPAVLIVDAQGVFEFQILPSVDLKGARSGQWAGAVCIAGTQQCWKGAFVINA